MGTHQSGRERIADSSIIPDSLFTGLSRAFNLDADRQQRDGTNFTVTTDDTNRTSNGSEGSNAPVNSFERFLVDLQTDLRVALTRMDNTVNDASNTVSVSSSLINLFLIILKYSFHLRSVANLS